MFSIQCLFCKHVNPAYAIFCNECGTQLNMQPCENCGAIDARSATNCYKCGTAFLSQEPPETAVASEPPADIHDTALPASIDTAVVPTEPSTSAVDQSAAHAFDRSRPKWVVASAGLLLALIAAMVFVYLNPHPRELLAEKLGFAPRPAAMSLRQKPVEAPPPARTAALPVPSNSTTQPVSGIEANESVVTAPNTKLQITPRQLPANDADTRVMQDSLASSDCPPAVATLGLCSPDAKSGKGR